MKLREIADRIHAHFVRIESDPELNAPDENGVRRWNDSYATWGGSKLFVAYVGTKPRHTLTRQQGKLYLAWLDSGGVGRHWDSIKARCYTAGTQV